MESCKKVMQSRGEFQNIRLVPLSRNLSPVQMLPGRIQSVMGTMGNWEICTDLIKQEHFGIPQQRAGDGNTLCSHHGSFRERS